MSEATPKNVLRIALLSTWGMITLVLVFVVSLLSYKMYQQEQDPLSYAEDNHLAAQGMTATSLPLSPSKTIGIDLFFASPTNTQLVSQQHYIELTTSTLENCRQALNALIVGPTSSALSPILSGKTRIRGMYLRDNNELIIDFSRDLEAGHIDSASADMLLVEGITQTLTQVALHAENDRSVHSIRFLFEGSPYQGTFPSHYDLSAPITLLTQVNQGGAFDAQ